MSAKVSQPLYREVKTGGRHAPRVPVPGEAVGESRVVERVGLRGKDAIWSVACSCGSIQIRSSNQINHALRRGYSLLCPECVKEYQRGSAAYSMDERSRLRLERVLDGGPVWSHWETMALQAEVLADLEEEFGVLDKDPLTVAEMQISAGWPAGRKIPTTEEKEAKAAKERDWAAYRRAASALSRLDKKARKPEIEALRARARELAKQVKDKKLAKAIADIQREQWIRVMEGEDLNPDRVTKKAGRERARTPAQEIDVVDRHNQYLMKIKRWVARDASFTEAEAERQEIQDLLVKIIGLMYKRTPAATAAEKKYPTFAFDGTGAKETESVFLPWWLRDFETEEAEE